MAKIKSERKFKREYIPVIVLGFILILLLALLLIVFRYEKKDYNIKIPDSDYEMNDLIIDTSDSLCSESEVDKLYNSAANITYEYSPTQIKVADGVNSDTGEKEDVMGTVYNVKIKDIPKDMYIIIENNNRFTKKEKVVLKSDKIKDNAVTYQTEYTDSIITYTVSVYTEGGDCANELFRKFTFNTPIKNKWSQLDICTWYPKFELCSEYINQNLPTYAEFYTELGKYIDENEEITSVHDFEPVEKEENKEDKEEKEKESKKSLKVVAIAGISLLAIVVIVTIIIVLKKKKV